jgi:hypothetical protein
MLLVGHRSSTLGWMHQMSRLLLLGLLAGCDSGNVLLARHHGSCSTLSDGVLSLAWTIRGAAPTATSCAGIDRLSVDVENTQCGVTIEPVPCALDHWRYDNLYEGPVTAVVSAIGTNGLTIASGSVDTQLTSVVPASPATLDLQ